MVGRSQAKGGGQRQEKTCERAKQCRRAALHWGDPVRLRQTEKRKTARPKSSLGPALAGGPGARPQGLVRSLQEQGVQGSFVGSQAVQ